MRWRLVTLFFISRKQLEEIFCVCHDHGRSNHQICHDSQTYDLRPWSCGDNHYFNHLPCRLSKTLVKLVVGWNDIESNWTLVPFGIYCESWDHLVILSMAALNFWQRLACQLSKLIENWEFDISWRNPNPWSVLQPGGMRVSLFLFQSNMLFSPWCNKSDILLSDTVQVWMLLSLSSKYSSAIHYKVFIQTNLMFNASARNHQHSRRFILDLLVPASEDVLKDFFRSSFRASEVQILWNPRY